MNQVGFYFGRATQVVDYKLEVMDISEDINVFRLTRMRQLYEAYDLGKLEEVNPEEEVQEGFVDDENLELLTKGQPFQKLDFVVFSDLLLQDIRHKSFYELWLHHESRGLTRAEVRHDAFEAFLNEEVTLKNLINTDYSLTYVYKDYQGTPIPMMILFDDVNGQLNNHHYDIISLLDILKQRDDVTLNISDDDDSYFFYTYHHDDERGLVGNQYLGFSWHPSDEDFAKLVASIDVTNTYELYRGIQELDLLGISDARLVSNKPKTR